MPNLGSFVVQLTNGRSDIIGILKRRKYNEILEAVQGCFCWLLTHDCEACLILAVAVSNSRAND